LGHFNLNMGVKFNQKGIWSGGQLFVELQNTHGTTPSTELVGDIQVFSNIENGNFTYLYQLWYYQSIGPFSFTIGRHDLNSEFIASDIGEEYLNSSFGIMGLAPINMPLSVFPKTSLGFVMSYKITDEITIKSGFYDGNPLDLGRDRYGLDFRISGTEGFLSITEFEFNNQHDKYPGTYKAGFFHHNGDFVNMTDTTSTVKGNSAYYVIADQFLYRENATDGQGLGAMFQFGCTPKDRSINNIFLSVGLNYYGLIPGRDEDILGLAMAHASISQEFRNLKPGALGHETAIDFTYKYNLSKLLTIQPDLQYIINPGVSELQKNAFVGVLRISLGF
jgi:porin